MSSSQSMTTGKLPLLRVSAVHVAIVLAVWIGARIQSCREPSEARLRVRLAAVAPTQTAPAPNPTPAPTPTPPTPTPPTPTPPTPTPPTPPKPTPPVPTPPQPKPTPVPTPTPTPPKPTPVPVKKVEPAPTPKKITETPPKEAPKPRYRTPEEIRAQYQNVKPTTPTETPRSTQQTSSARPAPSAADVARRLNGALASQPGPVAVNGGELPPADYFDKIMAVLYGAWQPPTIAEAPNGVTTRIQLEIGRSGRLTGASLVGGSGNAAMDESVKSLLASGMVFPPLPDEIRGSSLRVQVALRLQH